MSEEFLDVQGSSSKKEDTKKSSEVSPEEIKRIIEERLKEKLEEPQAEDTEHEEGQKEPSKITEINKKVSTPPPSPSGGGNGGGKKPSDTAPSDGGKIVGTLGDIIRGKVRVPGLKQYVNLSVSPVILLYHGIAIALGLVDPDTDLSGFAEQCIVDWMRWHGVELVIKKYPEMDMFLALQRMFGKNVEAVINELIKR